MSRAASSHHKNCGAVEPKSGVRCTKRQLHYPRTPHGNEKPGYEMSWTEDGTIITKK